MSPFDDRAHELDIRLPDEPPALTPGAARALLRLLLAESGPTPARESAPDDPDERPRP